MLAERATSLCIALATSILLARHLGASEFGLLQYAISFCAMFGLISNLGLDSLLVRDLIRAPERTGALLGTGAVLRATAAVVAICMALLASQIAGSGGQLGWMIGLVSLAFLPQFTTVAELYFLAHVRARIPMVARALAAVCSLSFILLGLRLHENLGYFAGYPLLEASVLGAVLVLAYSRSGESASPLAFDPSLARVVLREGWPLGVSFGLIAINANVGKLLIRHFLGDEALGTFAVASRLMDASQLLPAVVVASLFPAIVRAREQDTEHFQRRMQNLYDLMAGIGIVFAVPMMLFADRIIVTLYGMAYRDAGFILVLQSVYFGIVSVSVAIGRWLILEGQTRVYLLRSSVGVIATILLCYLLIPKHGIVGAVVAFGVSQVLVVISPAIHSGCRKQVMMGIKAIVLVSPVATVLRVLRDRV